MSVLLKVVGCSGHDMNSAGTFTKYVDSPLLAHELQLVVMLISRFQSILRTSLGVADHDTSK